jgi:hypothetical protein
MRKKTKNDNLARRAKDLVRRWRDMVSKPLENGTGGTGQGPGIIQGGCCHRVFSQFVCFCFSLN